MEIEIREGVCNNSPAEWTSQKRRQGSQRRDRCLHHAKPRSSLLSCFFVPVVMASNPIGFTLFGFLALALFESLNLF